MVAVFQKPHGQNQDMHRCHVFGGSVVGLTSDYKAFADSTKDLRICDQVCIRKRFTDENLKTNLCV